MPSQFCPRSSDRRDATSHRRIVRIFYQFQCRKCIIGTAILYSFIPYQARVEQPRNQHPPPIYFSAQSKNISPISDPTVNVGNKTTSIWNQHSKTHLLNHHTTKSVFKRGPNFRSKIPTTHTPAAHSLIPDYSPPVASFSNFSSQNDRLVMGNKSIPELSGKSPSASVDEFPPLPTVHASKSSRFGPTTTGFTASASGSGIMGPSPSFLAEQTTSGGIPSPEVHSPSPAVYSP